MKKKKKNNNDTWRIFHICITIDFDFFPKTTCHGMKADGLVGSGSDIICFPIALSGSETFLDCCWIAHVIHLCLDCVCRCDLGITLRERRGVKCVLIDESDRSV